MTREQYLEIRRLHEEGLSRRAIARRLGIHRRKVRQALSSEQLPKRQSLRRGSMIDPFRGWMLAKLQLYPELTAARLHAMLREQGFAGSYSLVKQAVAEIRPRLTVVYQSLSFEPGAAAQVDWGVWKSVAVPGGVRRLSFFTMVLCHSRMLYAEFFFGEALEYWLAAHRNALEYFGGVPEQVIVDNCKTAVIKPGRNGREPTLNEAYEDFAGHYGFQIIACTPGRPNEKGRVENAVGFTKTSFLGGREPSVPAAINPALRHWLGNVANTRTHRTTRTRPVDTFLEEEKPALNPLPATPHHCAAITNCVATSTCRVNVDTNRYSIDPQFASQRLRLSRYAERIEICDAKGNIAGTHPRNFGRAQEIVDPAHQEALSHFGRRAHQNRQISAFLGLGSHAANYLAQLKDKRVDYLNHVRQINAQAEIYGRDDVARAIADANEHHAYAADYILNLLAARQRLAKPAQQPLHVTRNIDLLNLDIDPPDLSVYEQYQEPEQSS